LNDSTEHHHDLSYDHPAYQLKMTELRLPPIASPASITNDHDKIATTTTTTTSSMPTLTSTPFPGRRGYRLIDGSKAYYRFSDIMFEASRLKSSPKRTARLSPSCPSTETDLPPMTSNPSISVCSGINNFPLTKPTRSNRY
jgi:hypothetical protein